MLTYPQQLRKILFRKVLAVACIIRHMSFSYYLVKSHCILSRTHPTLIYQTKYGDLEHSSDYITAGAQSPQRSLRILAPATSLPDDK